jgi:Fe2+ transport system protein FeoA
MSTNHIPLSRLHVGQSGVIVKVTASGPVRRRLLDMGVIRGETINVEKVAPLGDPIEYKIKGYHLSLRKSEANQVLVEAPRV